MKTSEMEGVVVLDYAVAKAAEEMFGFYSGDFYVVGEDAPYHPSTNWAQGGPIIEREGIEIIPIGNGEWRGQFYEEGFGKMHRKYGSTPLIAAMRCYVAYKLGDEVYIPEELK